MKKNLFGLVSVFLLVCFSCKGFEVQPKFITIFGADEKSIKLESYEQLADNSVKLVFSEAVALEELTVRNSADEQMTYTESVEKENGVEAHVIKIMENVAIGATYTVGGCVKSGKTTQSFSIAFVGKNINPAGLAIIEYKPVHSSAKGSDPEFIKLKVTKSGNVSEFALRTVGSKKVPDYIFPACEVSAGEVIFLHLHPAAETNAAENFADETDANVSRDIKTARDFYARSFDKPYKRDANVVVLDDGNNHVQDFLVCVQKKGFADGEFQWDEQTIAVIKELEQSGLKEAFEHQCKNISVDNMTGTTSLVKINGVWQKQKYTKR